MNVAFLLLISFVSVGLAKRKLSTISIDDNGRSKYFTTEDTTDNNNFTNYTHIRHLATSNNHKVTSLPGLSPEVSLNHFAGHLPVNKEGTGQLFYWFFEAEIDPDNGQWSYIFFILILPYRILSFNSIVNSSSGYLAQWWSGLL